MDNLSQIQVFNFSNEEIRVILTSEGTLYFAAIDVCNILGFQNLSHTIKRLDADEVISNYLLPDNIGRMQMTNLITESGLYSLVLGSKKPEAKTFKKWITSEVLPAIRKTGTYSLPGSTEFITKKEVLSLLKNYPTNADIEILIQSMDKGLSNFYEMLYNTHISTIEDKLERLETQIFPTLGEATIFIYIIQEGTTDHYKIGLSTQPQIRNNNLSTGNSQILTVVKTIPFLNPKEGSSFETHLQELFADKHIHGEWYRLNAQDLQFIELLSILYGKRVVQS